MTIILEVVVGSLGYTYTNRDDLVFIYIFGLNLMDFYYGLSGNSQLSMQCLI